MGGGGGGGGGEQKGAVVEEGGGGCGGLRQFEVRLQYVFQYWVASVINSCFKEINLKLCTFVTSILKICM